MKRLLLSSFVLIIISTLFSSCANVKRYEMVELNQPDMDLNARAVSKMESNFQSYREGASGANGGKVGGGCGCN